VWVNDRTFACALEAREDVQEEGIVAVFLRRNPECKAAIQVIGRIKAIAPGFGREWKICDNKVEGLEAAVAAREVWAGKGVVLPDFGSGAVMEDHIHPGQRGGSVVHLLPVEREVEAGAALGFIVRLQKQRAGAASGIVDGLAGALGAADTNDLGHDTRNLRRGIKLALALTRLGGKVPHEVFVGVAEQIIALGTVTAKVEGRVVENGDEVRQSIHHVFTLAQFVRVVEVRNVDHALEIIRLGQLRDDLVHPLANFLIPLERNHVGETATLGHVEQVILLAGGFIRDVFHEQQDEDIILVLRGVHAAAQFIATGPEGAIKFGFFNSHNATSLLNKNQGVNEN